VEGFKAFSKEEATVKKIIIQKAVLSNLDSIETIYNESIDWLNSQGIHQWKRGVYPTRDSAQEALKEDCLYCCFVDERLAGSFIINESQPSQYEALLWRYNNGKVLVLHTLVVRPYEAGKGTGRAIVEYIIDYAEKHHYTCIRLDVFPDNQSAVNLYNSFGFEFVGKVFFDIKEPSYEWYDCYEKLIADIGN
jgi:ribosomal protein S18 acetylase RimI-like enzyme